MYNSAAAISSSNIMLSPDETMLYVVNTQGATVSALFFDKTTGKIYPGLHVGTAGAGCRKLVVSGGNRC